MNRFCFLLFLFITSIMVYSQNEMMKDSLIIKRIFPQNEISKEPIIYQEPLINSVDIELKDREPHSEVEIKLPNYLNYRLKLTPDLKPQKLSSTLSYSLNGYGYNYGIGQYYQGGIEFVYKPLDKLTISFATYGVQYNILHSRYNDVVFNFDATYEFNSWLKLSGFGQYSFNSVNNARFGGYMFAPQTLYGATLQFKASEKVYLNVGIERSFNSLTKNWETNAFLGPSIRLK